MSELEKLNNKELRKMCQKFGMPKVPVTKTTRKVIIKRLEVAMSNKLCSTGKDANHRDTVHASAPAKMESSRPTITDNSNIDDRSVKSDNNKSTQAPTALSECTVSITTTDSYPESSDISPDCVSKQVYGKGHTAAKEDLQLKRPAKEFPSKKIVLTRSDTVTTSYFRESDGNVNKIYADTKESEQLIKSQVSATDGFINLGAPVSFFKPIITSSRSYENEAKFYYPTTSQTAAAPCNNKPRFTSRVKVNDDFPTHHPPWDLRQDYHYNVASVSSQQAKQRFVASNSPSKFLVKPPYVDEFDADDFEDEYDMVVAAPLADKYSPLSSPREHFRHRLDIPAAKVPWYRSLLVISPTTVANISSFMQLASALEEKYHFKWPLLINHFTS
uniref:LEM domain-containing protein n=1 Tax=Glossina palpalis gambiensis TaxID=67801 RepID=A0A1B0AME0_9MUSC